ncbi:MAG TPA: hypothetical protein VKA30_10395 [Actinomycetota bacterium]|nr:hypothetical protein [Actinomycetota bacterium]
MAIALAVALALAGAGTALAMTSDSSDLGPIDQVLPPKIKPSPTPLLTQPIQKLTNSVTTPDSIGSPTDGSGGDGTTTKPDADGKDGSDRTATAALPDSGLAGAWTIPYGDWRRFFDWVGGYGSTTSFSTATTTVPGQATSGGSATLSRVARTLPQTPAYLWLLLPFGLLILWAAAFAVFEPVRQPGGVTALARSVRQTARELPAGMTRTAARAVLGTFRRVGRWGRR